MKIHIASSAVKGELHGLADKFEEEGDSLVRLQDEPEIVLSDDPQIFGENVVSFGAILPRETLQLAGFEQVTPGANRHHALVRWYSYSRGWLDQLVLSIPLLTLFNWDLGQECPSGSIIKFLHTPSLNSLFENQMITQVLQELRHTGFVTLWRTSNGSIISLETGFPHYGLFAFCEGIRTKLSEWFSNPEPVLESWMCANLVSRWPYPFKSKDERVEVSSKRNELMRHLWLFEPSKKSRSYSTENTRVGVISAWNHNLKDSVARVLGDCWNLDLVKKQFRTDLVEKAFECESKLSGDGLI